MGSTALEECWAALAVTALAECFNVLLQCCDYVLM